MMPLAVRIILIANLVLLARLAILAAVVSPRLLPHLGPVLGIALAAGLITTFLQKSGTSRPELPPPETANPMELGTALSFGLAFAVVLFLAAWLTDQAGNRVLYIVALGAGITDVDAITLSALRLFELGNVSPSTAIITIVIALLANQTTKLAMIMALGGVPMFRQCAVPMATTGITAAIVCAFLP